MSPQLDPQAQALLEVMRAIGAPQPYELPVDQAREQMRASLVGKGAQLPLHEVRDVQLPSPAGPLALRLYRPAADVLPMALFLHGGGWTLNDLDTHDRLCRRLAGRSGWLVAALDYRRAPEHQHPAALYDALLAYSWLRDNAARLRGDASRLALVGESSGASTAACLSLLLRDRGAQLPCFQALAYPVVDASEQWDSYARYGNGYTLDVGFVRWALENYVPAHHDREDPYLFPLAAKDLGGLPPSLVLTAEFDPLRDGGLAYAERLLRAGVAVSHIHAEDQMHGFLLFDRAVQKAGALADRLAEELARSAPVSATDDR
jgi:acetyl esterase/lipase